MASASHDFSFSPRSTAYIITNMIHKTSSTSSGLWMETPLIHSKKISDRLGCDVYLKMENMQPPQSFKFRGISLVAQRAKNVHGVSAHLVIASGGNGGLAAAWAAATLGIHCSVFVPACTSREIVETLQSHKAEVVLSGENYGQALDRAREYAESNENAVLISTYDGDVLREGHSSLLMEIKSQLLGHQPDAIFCSVGGGGLIGGLLVGCDALGWDKTQIVALETRGADCFYHSMLLNGAFESTSTDEELPEGVTQAFDQDDGVHLAQFSKITSKACLGAVSPAPAVVGLALQRKCPVSCIVIPDDMAVHTAVRFAADHKTIVELACSTTLTPAYNRDLFQAALQLEQAKSQIGTDAEDAPSSARRTVVFIVCGSANVTIDEFAEYVATEKCRSQWTAPTTWPIKCNGRDMEIGMETCT